MDSPSQYPQILATRVVGPDSGMTSSRGGNAKCLIDFKPSHSFTRSAMQAFRSMPVCS